MSRDEQNERNITRVTMQGQWTLFKKIDVNDIIDKMLEKYLISVEKAMEIKEKGTQAQQTEALLYDVVRKPQHELDAFIELLEGNGYSYIVQTLRKDAATEAPEVPEAPDALEKSNPYSETYSASGGMITEETAQEEYHSGVGEGMMNEIKKLLEHERSQMMQKLTEKFEEVTYNSKQELLKQQTEMLEKQTAELVKQRFQMDEKHSQEFKKYKKEMEKQLSNMKENETKIKELDSNLRSLQNTLQRSKTKQELVKATGKIKDLEAEIANLQTELTYAKEHAKALEEHADYIMQTWDSKLQEVSKDTRSQEKPKPRNPFMAPLKASSDPKKGKKN